VSKEQVKIVQESWAKVVPIKDQAADLFYARLFEQYPEVKPLFKGDMASQGRKLMEMIDTAVTGLDDLGPLVEPVKDMGARHAAYGVKDEDYAKVAAALLWTLEQGLGEHFTPEVREAWTQVYTQLADLMKQGAAEAA
jgi:hemoglobin-like flavoprotein